MLGFLQKRKPVENLPQYFGPRYYVNMGGQARGPYPINELRRIPGFTLQSPLSLSATGEWKPAFTVIDLKAYVTLPTKPNEWDLAAAQAKQEKLRLAKKAKWILWKQAVWTFLRRLIYWTLAVIFMIAAGYAAVTGQIQPKLWKNRFFVLAHTQIQWSIGELQALDNRYFSPRLMPVKPILVLPMAMPQPVKVATPSPVAVTRSVVSSALPKPLVVAPKKSNHAATHKTRSRHSYHERSITKR